MLIHKTKSGEFAALPKRDPYNPSIPLRLQLFIKTGGKNLLYSVLLAAAPARIPDWSPTIGGIMVLCCLFAIAIGRFAIQRKGVGPKLPIELPDPFGGEFGIPELLATASFGHILGAGVILGLTNSGVL